MWGRVDGIHPFVGIQLIDEIQPGPGRPGTEKPAKKCVRRLSSSFSQAIDDFNRSPSGQEEDRCQPCGYLIDEGRHSVSAGVGFRDLGLEEYVPWNGEGVREQFPAVAGPCL